MSNTPTIRPGDWVAFLPGSVPRQLGAVLGQVVRVQSLGEHFAAKPYDVGAHELPPGVMMHDIVASVFAVTRALPTGFVFPCRPGTYRPVADAAPQTN